MFRFREVHVDANEAFTAERETRIARVGTHFRKAKTRLDGVDARSAFRGKRPGRVGVRFDVFRKKK